MQVHRGICVAVVVRAAVEHVSHVNGALVAKTKLGVYFRLSLEVEGKKTCILKTVTIG